MFQKEIYRNLTISKVWEDYWEDISERKSKKYFVSMKDRYINKHGIPKYICKNGWFKSKRKAKKAIDKYWKNREMENK